MSYTPLDIPQRQARLPSHPPMAPPSFFRLDAGHVRPKTDRKRVWSLVLSYTPDWAITILLAAVFFALDKVPGYKREFSLTDTSLRHTYAVHERVPDWALYIIAIAAPFTLQLIINLLSVRSWWDLHAGTLGLILSLAIAGSITQFSKITVGRPRPDLIARCIPASDAADPTLGLSTVDICTQTDVYILRDGFRSFPSGHSSLSFAGLGFLAFYLAGKLHLFDRRGHAAKAWLFFVPLSGAALVAISRTMDYRHHWQDVTTGSILGLAIAYYGYRQYYPPITSELCHRPYPPRVMRSPEEVLPIHYSQDRDSTTTADPIVRSRDERYSDGGRDEYELYPDLAPRVEAASSRDNWARGTDRQEQAST